MTPTQLKRIKATASYLESTYTVVAPILKTHADLQQGNVQAEVYTKADADLLQAVRSMQAAAKAGE